MNLKGIKKNKKSRDIIIGYNTPFVLWTIAAFFQPVSGNTGYSICPLKIILNWCPACGLIREYSHFIYSHRVNSLWFVILFCGFLLNSAYSFYKAGVINKTTAVLD